MNVITSYQLARLLKNRYTSQLKIINIYYKYKTIRFILYRYYTSLVLSMTGVQDGGFDDLKIMLIH